MPSKSNIMEVKNVTRNYSETVRAQFAMESLYLEIFQEFSLKIKI